jgi:hypothetical protein
MTLNSASKGEFLILDLRFAIEEKHGTRMNTEKADQSKKKNHLWNLCKSVSSSIKNRQSKIKNNTNGVRA